MNIKNEPEAVRRREALKDRIEQLRRMIEIRAVEERIQALFSEGHIRGSTHLANGQEAVAVGIAKEINFRDVVTCTYRGHSHALALGASPESIIGEICGRSIGCARGIGGSMHLMAPEVGLLPTFAIVGAGIPVACGAALAAKVKKTGAIAVAIFGDGATNIGAFHESLNFASIKKLPVIFICENNLYGEYTPIQLSTPIENIAIRGSSYGIEGRIVDGQDIDAVATSISDAAQKAREGEGPTLLEMKTYRFSGHSRSDPATYRPPGELENWLKKDPIKLFSSNLIKENLASLELLEQIKIEVTRKVEKATQKVLASSEPLESEILNHVYENAETKL